MDASGNMVADFTRASGKRIAYKRNWYAEAQLTLSHEEPAAAAFLNVWSAGGAGATQLRAYRNGTLRFVGWSAPFDEQSSDSSVMNLVFRSPFWRLIGDGSQTGRVTTAPVTYTATDAGTIAVALVALANAQGSTGLSTSGGTLNTSVNRTITYPSDTNIGQAIVNLSNVQSGFDFRERWSATVPGAILDIKYPLFGTVQTGKTFEYGQTTRNTVSQFSRSNENPINAVRVVGANGLIGTASDSSSQTSYGYFPLSVQMSNISDQTTLNERAAALLRVAPIKTVRFVPEGLNAPKPFDDYDLGDTVRVYARRSALLEDLAVRINGFTVVVDENGNETSSIEDPLSPDDQSRLYASLSTEVV
jgi:hypothetical protein